MKIVYISFPLYNDKEMNKQNSDKYSKYALQHKFLPITSFSFVEQFERIDTNQEGFFSKRLEIVKRCDQLWVFQEELEGNMTQEVRIAKISGIPIRKITIGAKQDIILGFLKYKKVLNEVNRYLYSGGQTTSKDFNIDFYYTYYPFNIEKDTDLSKSQVSHIKKKIGGCDESIEYLDKGYRFAWNLNNNKRDFNAYMRTRYYIERLEMGERKIHLMRKMFEFSKRDRKLMKHHKESIVESLFTHIKKESNNSILDNIYEYEEMYDLVEAFLED